MRVFKRSMIAVLMFFIVAPAAIVSAGAIKAIVVDKFGNVQIKRADSDKWKGLYVRNIINEKDTIKTSEGSYVYIKFADNRQKNFKFSGSAIRIGENSQITLEKARYLKSNNRDIKLNMNKGHFLGKVPKKFSESFKSEHSDFELETPVAVVGVRGTGWGTDLLPRRPGDNYNDEWRANSSLNWIQAVFTNEGQVKGTVKKTNEKFTVNAGEMVTIVQAAGVLSRASMPTVHKQQIKKLKNISKGNRTQAGKAQPDIIRDRTIRHNTIPSN